MSKPHPESTKDVGMLLKIGFWFTVFVLIVGSMYPFYLAAQAHKWEGTVTTIERFSSHSVWVSDKWEVGFTDGRLITLYGDRVGDFPLLPGFCYTIWNDTDFHIWGFSPCKEKTSP